MTITSPLPLAGEMESTDTASVSNLQVSDTISTNNLYALCICHTNRDAVILMECYPRII